MRLVDRLEDGSMPAKLGLGFLMALLKNRSEDFYNVVEETICLAKKQEQASFTKIKAFLIKFFHATSYSARAFEVVLHGFMQAMEEKRLLGEYQLVPISQMRSANKKHGNIGDIELKDGQIVVEAWDAKYGKPYLRDELEELKDKISALPGVKLAGFVVDRTPDCRREITERMEELTSLTGCTIKIVSFEEWIDWQTSRIPAALLKELGYSWLLAVVESFGQRRLDLAPIDEPCEDWIKDLRNGLKEC